MLLGFVLGDQGSERLVKSVKCIDVSHHAVGSVDDGEMISEKFLGEAANLVQWTFVI